MASTRADDVVQWLRDRAREAGASGFVVGLSGGIDSAVAARLCQMAMPNRVLGVILPCYSHTQDESDARLLARTFGIPTARVDLTPTFDSLTGELHAAIKGLPTTVHVTDIKQQTPEANIKPRLRMTSLYFIANSLNYLVAGTGNRSELTLGYFTKHGDGGSDVLPIGHLLKSEVRVLARELGVPASIIDKAPSAGLWIGQTDEAEMGFSYELLETYLSEGPDAVPADVAQRIAALHSSSEHKRKTPPMPPSV
jgi:NAD+ synthase